MYVLYQVPRFAHLHFMLHVHRYSLLYGCLTSCTTAKEEFTQEKGINRRKYASKLDTFTTNHKKMLIFFLPFAIPLALLLVVLHFLLPTSCPSPCSTACPSLGHAAYPYAFPSLGHAAYPNACPATCMCYCMGGILLAILEVLLPVLLYMCPTATFYETGLRYDCVVYNSDNGDITA